LDTEEKVEEKEPGWVRSLFVLLRRYLITGIVVTAPVAVTIWILWNSFSFVDKNVKKILGESFADVPGVGFVLFFAVIILVGIFATNIIGKRLISFGEKIMTRIPLANRIYKAVQQISTAFLGSGRSIFHTVVLVEYPRKGIYSLGFLTIEGAGEVQHKTEQQVSCVFVPTTPNPTSGMLVFVPHDQLIFLDMATEDGLKLVVSGGVVAPPYPAAIVDASEELDKKE
jgi:uncharacterized membrane protein